MNLGDLKVYSLNTLSLMVSFSSAEDALKIILLMATIGYTIQKWYLMNKKDDREDI
tara:strand:- start:1919 stop:2086 length:168 start_codon:yes stop_codon:yes gene_type:complete